MVRFWNSKESAHKEAIEGILRTNPGKYGVLPSEYGYGLYCNDLKPNRVRIIVNGGGGYGPMWSGFADKGLADAMVHGEFDSAPNAYALYEMAKTIDDGCGVLFLANYFMGDYLNNDMAVELLEYDGIKARACYISDDVLSCPGEDRKLRSGLHGIGQICKIASQMADQGICLDKIYKIVEKTKRRLHSVSVNIRDGNMILGEGFSGEPSSNIVKYCKVDQMTKEVCEVLMKEFSDEKDNRFYVSVNCHSGVSYTESMIILNSIVKELEHRKKEIVGCAAGVYFDVFEGSGCMISLLSCDSEIEKYLYSVKGYNFTL